MEFQTNLLLISFAVTIIFAAWALSSSVGIDYLSILFRTGVGMVLTMIIALLLYGVQRLIFTAFGGLATLIICILIGCLLQFMAIMALRIFDKDEWSNFPFAFLTKGVSRFF